MGEPARNPTPKPLRDYQSQALALVRDEMRRGRRRVVLVAPTGSGKTRMGAEIGRLCVEKGRRALWVAHRTELIDQTCAALDELGLRVGAIAARSAWPLAPDAPVQVGSIQTLLAREVRPPADLLVWDECHHASEGAAEWATLLAAYEAVPAVGLTATPERGDGSGLAPWWTGLAVATSVRKLTEAGYLVPCEIVRPDTVLEAGHIAQHPLDAYRAHGGGGQGLLFARNVAEAQAYAEEFTAAGIRTVCVHAKTSPDERAAALAGFRGGRVRMLANVYVFTEGTDLTMASVCILARGASTAGIYLQMAGRVLRPHPGKTHATLIDLRGVSWIHGPPEDDRIYSLDGRGISRAQATCKVCGALLIAYPCPGCGYAPEAGEGEASSSEIDGVQINKFARRIAESPDQRWETCVRWVRAAQLKGHKVSSVRHKWLAVYREELPFAWLRVAEAIVVHGEPDRGRPS